MVKAAEGVAPPLHALAGVPAELVAVIAKAMAITPDDRYRDGNELAKDLRRFLGGQLVAAHRYTAGQRFARWMRRHRVAVATGALAVVALAIVGAYSLHSVTVAREVAEQESTRARTALEDMLAKESQRAAAEAKMAVAEKQRRDAEAQRETAEQQLGLTETQGRAELQAEQRRLAAALHEAEVARAAAEKARAELQVLLDRERARVKAREAEFRRLSEGLK